MGAVRIGLAVFYSEEGTAAHTGIDIALFQLFHNLGGNVVRNHTFGSTPGSKLSQIPVGGLWSDIVLIQYIDQLGEGRGNPHTVLILYSLHPLTHDFLNDHGKVIAGLPLGNLSQIHEHGYKRRLSVTGHEGDQLVLDSLDSAGNLVLELFLRDSLNNARIQRFSQLLAEIDGILPDLFAADLYKRSQM